MSEIGVRLREERERLGLSQAALGELAGVKKNAQFNYETGKRSPDLAYLAAVAEQGVDPLYVVTGQRMSPSAHRVIELTRKHKELLERAQLGDEVGALEDAEDGTALVVRDDLERWSLAIATVEATLEAMQLRLDPRAKAELILAGYDLLEFGDASSRDRVVRLVRASGER